MYKQNYLESLRAELVDAVREKLSPIALKYHYSEVPLEANIKWKPMVLILGNYSSGKSTLINELLGGEVQATGQAPTDDSFTVITQGDGGEDKNSVRVLEERDGKVLLNDETYPFKLLRKHGDRFAAHLRMKKVNSPFLDNLAIIDTPGMLDSSSERDRGYDYQQVIGDLAQTADLILVLFDPHKAGTVREAHLSLRETLPARTFEDRVIFVLNRIDECSNLNDLLRVYGTLCWNLSQMTGRKDIPMIQLTYSEEAAGSPTKESADFLPLLKNQRQEIKQRILEAPRYRLDNLASYIETHGERLAHLLEALCEFSSRRFWFQFKWILFGILVGVIGGGAAWLIGMNGVWVERLGELSLLIGSLAIGGVCFVVWVALVRTLMLGAFFRRRLQRVDDLTKLGTQSRRDTWAAVRPLVKNHLTVMKGRVRGRQARVDFKNIESATVKASKEARHALGELSSLPSDAVIEAQTHHGSPAQL